MFFWNNIFSPLIIVYFLVSPHIKLHQPSGISTSVMTNEFLYINQLLNPHVIFCWDR